MPHWIAVNWDKNQLLILAAKTKKGKAFYEKAVRILPDLRPDRSDDSSTDGKAENQRGNRDEAAAGFTPETAKAKLRHFVQQERLGKYDTVVVLGRDDVEVRSMLFPPVPNDELPDMARFQAPKEFTEYDHSASLDFVLFDGARKDKKHILASVLPKSRRETVEDVISGAGLDLQRIVLGPCESAKRFATITVQQRTGGAGKTTLLVEMGECSATLILLYRGQPAFVRTAHFQKPVWSELEQADKKSFDNPEELANWKWLTAEFKRTIVAAINDVPSEKVDEIVLCGAGERYEKLVRLLEESLAVPVSLFNVWRFENREGEIKNHLPAFEEQFLPLIGALTAVLAEKPNALDFRNPKRKPEKQSNRTLITAAVSLCVLLVLAAGAWGFYRRTTLEGELRRMQNEQSELEKATADFDRQKQQNDSINTWKKGNVNWLEELEWLSTNMPRSQDVIVSGQLQLSAPVKADPFMKFTANTRGTTIVPQLENNLRDETHKVVSPQLKPSQNQTYTHVTDITVKITPTFPASNVPVRPTTTATTDAPATAETATPTDSQPPGPDAATPPDRRPDNARDNQRGPQNGPRGQGGPPPVETPDVADNVDVSDAGSATSSTETPTEEPVADGNGGER